MKHTKLENPFPTTTYYGKEYFCDREQETSRILSNIKSGNSTTLLSIRRIGKTGLLKHVIEQFPEDIKGIYIDILETENLTQFLNLLTTGILQAIPQKSNFGEKIWEFITSLRPTISFDTLSGEPQASFVIQAQDVQTNIANVFQFLENQNYKIIIALDEFQQILTYPEKNIDAWLRTKIQHLKNIHFIFSGSEQHIMQELFNSPKRPFYRSTHILKLEKINRNIYAEFIVHQFAKHKKEIPIEIAYEILEWTNTHTFFVQQLCNRVFEASHDKATTEIWKNEARILLKEQEYVFFSYRNMLTNNQWNLLKAIAHEGIVLEVTAQSFIKKHNLGSSATVLRSLHSLLTYELLYCNFDESGKKFYSVYDILFQRWAQTRI